MRHQLMKEHGGNLNAYVLLLMDVCVFLSTYAYIVFMRIEARGQTQVYPRE